MSALRFKDEAEFVHWQIQREKQSQPKDKNEDADKGPESRLAGKIMKWAKDHGYPCQCFRQSQKAKGFLTKGFPD